jgi:sugar/nucleoside kinase (ribokinase family)
MELPLEKAMLFANRISAQVVSTEGASIPDTLVREIASSLDTPVNSAENP